MRIAGLGFARLRGPNSTYALLLNRGRLKYNGERILSPIGGGLTLYEPGQRLVRGLGAEFEGKPTDMQFAVPDQNVPDIMRWFRTTAYREHSVLREAYEELGEETSILTEPHLAGMTERFSHFACHDGATKRPVPDKRTAYLIDVFDLRMVDGSNAMRRLVAASQKPVAERWLYFVTRKEIEAGKSGRVAIGPICRKLLP